jgi:murein DD-endopeptidase MepM/ murein hydrolase activator NlpD
MRKTFCLSILLAALAYLTLPMPGLSESLPAKIGKTRDQIAGKRAKEGVLTTQITAFQVRIRSLQGDINGLQQRQDRVQVDLNAKQAELTSIRDNLQRTQDRLAKLRTRLAGSKRTLAARLVALYKDDEPDMLSVVLTADGFNELLDRADFLSRISEQDNRIVTQVRDLTGQVSKQATQLATLEHRAQDATNQILAKRNEILNAKQTVVSRQSDLVAVRDRRATALASIRSSRSNLEGHLHDLVGRQNQIEAKLRAAAAVSSGGGVSTGSAGPIKRGSGNFIWPVNGPIVSPFGNRNLGGATEFHPGIDIAVPSGTPIRAAAAGTVALEQPESASGGYGNFTCIQHSSTISTCYAHQERFVAHVGQHVSQGEVIGISDCTGRCFGPHVHFEVRVNGQVTDPLAYL